MRVRLAVVALVLLAVGCAAGGTGASSASGGNSGAADSPADQSLYQRLGGLDPIREVVDELVARIASDLRINRFFVDADIRALKGHLVAKLCEVAGGPCTYSGRTMREAHAGMGVAEADFAALLENLAEALDQAGVAERDKRELLARVGGMKADIVER